MLLAKLWYFCYSGGLAFILPYLNLHFELFMTREQIGLLSALRPWLAAPCCVLLTSLADRFTIHGPLLAASFAACVALRCLMMLVPRHFLPVALVVLLAECIGSPVGAIVDANVVAAVADDYGKHRMWGSIGWGALSVVAGWLVARRGLEAGFAAYVALSLPCFFIALKLRGEAAAAAAASTPGKQPAAKEAAAAPKQQQRSAKPNSNPQQEPALAAASTTQQLGCQDDESLLLMRLLPSTPNSNAGSGLGNSLSCSPEPGCRRRCDSPFAGCQLPDQDGHSSAAGSGKAAAGAENTAPDDGDSSELIKACWAGFPAAPEGEAASDSRPLSAAAGDPPANCSSGLANGLSLTATKQSAKLDTLASLKQAGSTEAQMAATLDELDEQAQAPLLLAESAKQLSPAADRPTGHALVAGNSAESITAAASGSLFALLLKQPAALLLLWRATIMGLGLGAIGSFVFLHVEELGGTPTLFGMMLAFNILTEAPGHLLLLLALLLVECLPLTAFALQSWILERLSVSIVFNASMVLLAVRLAGYAVLPLLHNPWLVLGLELMHGCTFATSWGAGIVFCKQLVPPHLNASMQGLFASLYGGVGSGLGALLGGVLMQQLGGQQLFLIMALIVLGAWGVGLAAELLLKARARNKPDPAADRPR